MSDRQTGTVKWFNNAAFVERAPAEIVSAERQKLEQAEMALQVLEKQRAQIEELRSA